MAFNSYMHDRNIYKERPDFRQIALDYPEFRQFAVPNEKGKVHVDFNDKEALKAVTKILLKKDFNLSVEIPDGFLIPTVPQRLNYILWVEDLLSLLPTKPEPISGIDVGTGPCAIFSLLGAKKSSWTFTSTETSSEAIKWAEKNIKANNLDSLIKVVKVGKDTTLGEVLSTTSSTYDFCLCNPPFFENIEEIKKKNSKVKETIAVTAKKEEIVSVGGEVSFVQRMIRESLVFKNRIRLYTSMFGKKKSFLQIWKELQGIADISVTKTEFCQGNTIRWGVAWTFIQPLDFEQIDRPKLKKPKKIKPPLSHKICCGNKDAVQRTVKCVLTTIHDILIELEIISKVNRSAENYAEIQITTDRNTWSHQRRKRREHLKEQVPESPQHNSNPSTLVSGVKDDICNVTYHKESEDISIEDLISEEPSNTLLISECQKESNIRKTMLDDSTKDFASLEKGTEKDIQSSQLTSMDDTESKMEPAANSDSMLGKRKKTIDLMESSKKRKLDVNAKAEPDNDAIFEPQSLLYCTLKLRKGKEHILLEANCPPDANRESMHQIFQFLKNKFC